MRLKSIQPILDGMNLRTLFPFADKNTLGKKQSLDFGIKMFEVNEKCSNFQVHFSKILEKRELICIVIQNGRELLEFFQCVFKMGCRPRPNQQNECEHNECSYSRCRAV